MIPKCTSLKEFPSEQAGKDEIHAFSLAKTTKDQLTVINCNLCPYFHIVYKGDIIEEQL